MLLVEILDLPGMALVLVLKLLDDLSLRFNLRLEILVCLLYQKNLFLFLKFFFKKLLLALLLLFELLLYVSVLLGGFFLLLLEGLATDDKLCLQLREILFEVDLVLLFLTECFLVCF